MTKLSFEWGTAADPAALDKALAEGPGYKAVLVTHNETSTGVTNPLADLAAVARKHDVLIIVDAVSSLSAVPCRVDAWDLDVVVTGSQKGWMVPPALAMISVSERAWKAYDQAKMPRFYFDVGKAKKYLETDQTPWTPAISVFFALDVALKMMLAEGLENIFARHERIGKLTREGVKALGLELLADEQFASNTVSAVKVPEGVDGKALVKLMREEYDTVLAGGQASLAGKIFRIGHLGLVSEGDITACLDALKMALPRVGFAPRASVTEQRSVATDRRVLVTDPIAQDGIDALARCAAVDVKLRIPPDELLAIIGEYDALVVRSETKVTAPVIEAGKKLVVIGRAGVGVDNIDLEAATERGVIVVNAPLGNTMSAAEHTIALMLSLSRYIPQANATLKSGKWERQRFMGVEVRGKTLGIIGLGQIGSEVARRARGLDMHVIACDPFVSEERAQSLIVEMVSLEDLLRRSDYIAIHTALTPQTRGLIGEKELRLVKPCARIINVARGGIVDEEALYRAVEEGRVAGAAVDVFSKEPAEDSILFKSDRIIVTPHLGASTAEAQERVALDVAEQIAAIFRGEPPAYSVNAPLVPPETMAIIGPYIEVAVKTASLATQLSAGQLNSVEVEYLGEIADHDVTPLKAAVIKGLLEPVSEENVTIVNANLVAEHRGLRISERKGSYEGIFTNLIQVRATTNEGTTTVSGTMGHDGPHIVQINEFWVDVSPGAGYLLICENIDRPGMIGTVGMILGKHQININSMRVAGERGRAMMVLGLDSAATDDVVEEMATVPDIFSVRRAKI